MEDKRINAIGDILCFIAVILVCQTLMGIYLILKYGLLR